MFMGVWGESNCFLCSFVCTRVKKTICNTVFCIFVLQFHKLQISKHQKTQPTPWCLLRSQVSYLPSGPDLTRAEKEVFILFLLLFFLSQATYQIQCVIIIIT